MTLKTVTLRLPRTSSRCRPVSFSNPPKPLRVGVLWKELPLYRQPERNNDIQQAEPFDTVG